ncbi:MAG: hypothetical protein DMF63_14740 [Acidobacteria bacterium]|nr:MAG: hypothetical protein DMF63_14740 [Acidobacteriota bacterium]
MEAVASCKIERRKKAFRGLRTGKFDAAEATALQAGMPAVQSHPHRGNSHGLFSFLISHF